MDILGNVTRLIKNLLLLIMTAVIFILISELVVRQFYPVFSYSYPQYYFVNDEELGYDISKNAPLSSHNIAWEGLEYDIWSNDIGCFDYQFDNDVPYYFLTGDSFSWGYAAFEDKWGYLLEKNIKKRILKCAVTGFETKGQLIKTKNILKEIPITPEKIIIGYFVGNDVKDRYLYSYKSVYDGHLVRTRYISSDKGDIKTKSTEDLKKQYENFRHLRSKMHLGEVEYFLLQWSSIYGMYHRLLHPVIPKEPDVKVILSGSKKSITLDESLIYRVREEGWENRAWEMHLSDIDEFVKYAKSVKSEAIFVLIPAKEQVYSFLQKDGIDYSKPNKYLINYFSKNNIKYIDLLGEFRDKSEKHTIDTLVSGESYYYPKDAHWNKHGNALAAEIVSAYMRGN